MRRLLRAADDRGATAVELALVLPLLLTLLAGMLLFGLRGVHSALAQNAARAALRTAVLPQSSSDRTIDADEVCRAALDAVPALLRPAAGGCGTSGTRPASGTMTVQVCPPACDGPLLAAACPTSATPGPVAAPARLRAQSGARARVVALAASSSGSPEPTSTASPTREPSFGGLLTPTSTPAPEVPTPTPSPTLPSPPSTVAATVSPTPVVVPVPDPEATLPLPGQSPLVVDPTVPPLPTAFPEPSPPPRQPACGDLQEGRRVAVRVAWTGAALQPLVGLSLGALGPEVTTVTAVATGRRE